MGLEGIVSKRNDSRYRSGRSLDWIKSKKPNAPFHRAGRPEKKICPACVLPPGASRRPDQKSPWIRCFRRFYWRATVDEDGHYSFAVPL
jgi:hypothetical protein